MSDIVEIGRRISAAFDTIASELEKLPAGGTEEAASLRAELEAERTARQEAEARASAVEEEAAQRHAAMERQLAEVGTSAGPATADDTANLLEALEEQTALAERLKQENTRLQTALEAAEKKQANGAGADQINQALVSEIEELKAARESDRAEMDEILSALKPLLSEVNHA